MEERILSYTEAINEALIQTMEYDKNILIFGQGVDDVKRLNGTTNNLVEMFGSERVFDVPVAEDSMTGISIGMAMGGLIPINTHIRMDFNLLTFNQLINMAAKLKYMYGGVVNCPLVIKTMIGKSWGQGPQHSQAFYSMLMNIPGITVIAPSTPYDAKGMMIEAIISRKPVVYIEHRLLHFQKGPVPREIYTIGFGHIRYLNREQFPDVTLVGISQMSIECFRAAKLLDKIDIFADVIDLSTLNPLNNQVDEIVNSIAKSGNLIFVECGWLNCGAGAEIIARLKERSINFNVKRMGFAECTCPTTPSLESEFYPNSLKIAKNVCSMLGEENPYFIENLEKDFNNTRNEEVVFKGPF